MADTVVTAIAGESLDALIWRATGGGASAVEATLSANPGLAAESAALPEGRAVTVPATAPTVATVDLVNLWD
jgi:phage tail protein X